MPRLGLRIHAAISIIGWAAFATPLVGQLSVPDASSRQCVALGFGHWAPARPSWLTAAWWREPPHVQLYRHELLTIRGVRWDSLGVAPFFQSDSTWRKVLARGDVRMRDFFWGWRATTPDSIEFVRIAALSYGLWVRGKWHGDTLRGRAHSFSDVVSPGTDPRANAYGVRYDCDKEDAADAAVLGLRVLLHSDHRDSQQDAREIASERAHWDSLRLDSERPR